MLDGLLGRGFSSKCKSLIKPTRTRIDVLRKRKEATQRFLKGNLAQLLSNGLDINAFGRTEEFLAGLNALSCYDFIEQSCEYILKKLSAMQKQRECPEECREAVGSLMFAAARFSDLPELRDLRDAFQERYECSLEHFVNQEFVERLALKPPTIEKKIQLLHDIALEFSIKWDSGGFQQRMANPSVLAQNKPKKAEPIHVHGSTHNICTDNVTANTNKQDHLFKEKGELTSDRHRAKNDGENYLMRRDEWGHQPYGGDESTGKSPKPRMRSEPCTPRWDNYDVTPRGRQELNNDENESTPRKVKKETVRRRDRHRSSSREKRPEVVDRTYEVQKNRMNGLFKREGYGSVSNELYAEVPSNLDGKNISSPGYMDDNQPNTAKLPKINQVEGVDSLNSHSSYGLPPPYVKPKDKLVPPPYIKSRDAKDRINKEAKGLSSASDGASVGPSKHERENGEGREERILGESDHSNFEDQGTGLAHVKSGSHEKNVSYRDNIPLPRPRSIRRKHSKSSSNRDDLGNSEDSEVVKRSSSSRRRDHHSKKGLQILFDDEHKQRDEEERIIDKLLLHYSKKPSTCDQEKVRRKAKSHACETPYDGLYEGETLPHPTRSVSLPREQITSKQQIKVYARANSFQPDKPATHVHPKLPDYDDLAAQFAALKGR